MKRIKLNLVGLILVALMLLSCGRQKKAKYVFYFIGDGMGFSHIALTEAYKAQLNGLEIGSEPLLFTQFPEMGMATTFSASNPITCSSAAGTALSTGTKTANHMLGMTPDSVNLTSISYKIHNAGYKVGVMTTVTIDHATPGAFYASSPDRNDYFTVAMQLPKTGFEFFGGGGFQGAKPLSKDTVNTVEILNGQILTSLEENGYKVAYGMDDFNTLKTDHKERMVLLQQHKEQANEILPYAMLRKEGDLSLKQVVEAAVEYLYNDKGFFIMAEGGKIDWGAHSNDIANTIYEILDMDEAIAVAYEFYKQHPDETLIVVTADHETGGVSLGKRSGYVFDLKPILEASKMKSNIGSSVEDYMKVVPSDSLSVVTKIGWTTTSHTGGAVPVFAVGAGSEAFGGRMDNTDIPKKICAAIGVEF